MNLGDLGFHEFVLCMAVWVVAMIAAFNYGSHLHHHHHNWMPFIVALAAGPVYLVLLNLHRKFF